MNCLFLRLILAARDDNGSLVDILIFLVMLFFYGIGVLVKISKKKAATNKQGKQKPEPVSRPHPAVVKPHIRPAGRKVVRPAAARSATKVQRPVPRMKIPSEADGIVELAGFESKPKLGKVSDISTETGVKKEMSQTEYLPDILSDYEDTERLRRAILHYEILGKPISLRESSEHIGGF